MLLTSSCGFFIVLEFLFLPTSNACHMSIFTHNNLTDMIKNPQVIIICNNVTSNRYNIVIIGIVHRKVQNTIYSIPSTYAKSQSMCTTIRNK